MHINKYMIRYSIVLFGFLMLYSDYSYSLLNVEIIERSSEMINVLSIENENLLVMINHDFDKTDENSLKYIKNIYDTINITVIKNLDFLSLSIFFLKSSNIKCKCNDKDLSMLRYLIEQKYNIEKKGLSDTCISLKEDINRNISIINNRGLIEQLVKTRISIQNLCDVVSE